MSEYNKQIEENKVSFGHKALELTNEFRKSQGLGPLQWNQELCNIGMRHSIDMAEGMVPFGHQNFQNRVQKISFHHMGVYENVAYCYNMSDTPKVIIFFFVDFISCVGNFVLIRACSRL